MRMNMEILHGMNKKREDENEKRTVQTFRIFVNIANILSNYIF